MTAIPELLEFGRRFVEVAGVDILAAQQAGNYQISEKPDGTSVTTMDREINDRLIEAVQDRFPGHGVIGEERSLDGSHDEQWVIDPIDGTRGYVSGEPDYSVSLAYVRSGAPLLGIVFAPAMDSFYIADSDSRVARKNGEEIHVGCQDDLYRTWYGAFNWETANPSLDHFRGARAKFPGRERRVVMGSVALQFCRVADGFFGFSVFPGRSAYDVVAGALIIRCAGGQATDLRGGPINPTGADNFGALASNGKLHDQVLEEIREHCLGSSELELVEAEPAI